MVLEAVSRYPPGRDLLRKVNAIEAVILVANLATTKAAKDAAGKLIRALPLQIDIKESVGKLTEVPAVVPSLQSVPWMLGFEFDVVACVGVSSLHAVAWMLESVACVDACVGVSSLHAAA